MAAASMVAADEASTAAVDIGQVAAATGMAAADVGLAVGAADIGAVAIGMAEAVAGAGVRQQPVRLRLALRLHTAALAISSKTSGTAMNTSCKLCGSVEASHIDV